MDQTDLNVVCACMVLKPNDSIRLALLTVEPRWFGLLVERAEAHYSKYMAIVRVVCGVFTLLVICTWAVVYA